jgi:hypothetical protein
MKTGIELIAQERREQIEKHGRTIERDVKDNYNAQLPTAAMRLLQFDRYDIPAPFLWRESIWEKMNSKPYKDRLIIAGALIAAEIDRINYSEQQDNGE